MPNDGDPRAPNNLLKSVGKEKKKHTYSESLILFLEVQVFLKILPFPALRECLVAVQSRHQENMSVKCIPTLTPLLHRKTGVCSGIHIFSSFCSKT